MIMDFAMAIVMIVFAYWGGKTIYFLSGGMAELLIKSEQIGLERLKTELEIKKLQRRRSSNWRKGDDDE